MTALRKPGLPAELRTEMARLKGAGFNLLPLGGGADGKAPLLRNWTDPGLTLARILAPMHRAQVQVYGVRLDGLAVVDCDTDDARLVMQMEARFGASPVHVRTPRGRHLYYRAADLVPNLRAEGLPVDIKTGARSYVAGPLSVRPDGGFYAPAKGALGVDRLPLLRAPTAPQHGAAPILTGHRHVELVQRAVEMVELVDSAEELQANLAAIRDDWCADPATMPDAELRGIAEWTWRKRLENAIFRGRNSAFPMPRPALDALRSQPNGADAIALLAVLLDLHGHRPGLRFPLDFTAMRAAGVLNLPVPRFRAARRVLERAELIRRVGNHQAGRRKQTFVLTRPLCHGVDDGQAVVPMPSRSGRRPGEGGGEGFTYL